MSLLRRNHRNRKSPQIRSMLRETHLHPSNLILPLFVVEDAGEKQPILSMPGHFRFGRKQLLLELEQLQNLGLCGVALFPVVQEKKKDFQGSEGYLSHNFYADIIHAIKSRFPQILVMSDVALDPYTTHGHDGLLDESTLTILNDETVEVLCQMAHLHAEAGADIIGPSDMMDGRVLAIRNHLDTKGYTEVNIFSYTAKYASNFYTPFRDALQTKLSFGDKKTYQMDYSNVREALQECISDYNEGADLLLIKPAMCYLDVVYRATQCINIPVGVYHTSGEFSMIKAAGERGWLQEKHTIVEIHQSFCRAGAKVILTYFCKEILTMIQSGEYESILK